MTSNIWGIVIVAVISLIGYLINKAIVDSEKRSSAFQEDVKKKFDQVDEHITNTDKNVAAMEKAHNELKLNVVGELNSLKIEILNKLNQMSLEIAQWKNRN